MTISEIKSNKIRGDEKKKELVANFDLTPVSHTTLMKNQKRKCICGNQITSSYHIFIAVKNKSKEKVFFNTGPGCSKTLLNLANIEALPLVNILQNLSSFAQNETDNSIMRNRSSRMKFSDFNSELNIVIGMYCASRDWYPSSIGTISRYTNKFPQKNNYQGAEWFNDRLINENDSVSKILNKLAKENEIKDLRFPLLNQFLTRKANDCRVDK